MWITSVGLAAHHPCENASCASSRQSYLGYKGIQVNLLLGDRKDCRVITTTHRREECNFGFIWDNILVECISSGGAPLRQETLTPIEIVCFPKTHIVRDPSGSGFMQTDYDVYSEEPLSIGDQIRYPDPFQGKTIDIYVKNNSGAVDLEYDNTQPFRVYHCA